MSGDEEWGGKMWRRRFYGLFSEDRAGSKMQKTKDLWLSEFLQMVRPSHGWRLCCPLCKTLMSPEINQRMTPNPKTSAKGSGCHSNRFTRSGLLGQIHFKTGHAVLYQDISKILLNRMSDGLTLLCLFCFVVGKHLRSKVNHPVWGCDEKSVSWKLLYCLLSKHFSELNKTKQNKKISESIT